MRLCFYTFMNIDEFKYNFYLTEILGDLYYEFWAGNNFKKKKKTINRG